MAGTFHDVNFPKHLCTGKTCVTCQDTFHKVTSQDRQLRTGKSDVNQQPTAGLTLLASCCPIVAAARVIVDFPSRCGFVPFCPMPFHKSIGRVTLAMMSTA